MDEASSRVIEHYDELADGWERITTGPAKEHVLLPALRSLLPDPEGKRVLDAGCGDGYYAAELAERGADVIGVDASAEMVRVARERHGDAAAFLRGDLTDGLGFEPDAFDVVLCQYVLSHLPSPAPALEAFARVLRPGGDLLLSTHHPFHDYLVAREEAYPDTHEALEMGLDPLVVTDGDETSYHETERFEIYWGGSPDGTPGTYYRRSLSDLLQPLLDAGFDLRDVVEPTPTEPFEAEYPALARELRRRPSRSVCLRAER